LLKNRQLLSPLVPPASFLVAAVAVELVMAAPEVTSKDMRQPVFVAQLTGAAVLAKSGHAQED
jgi:hypothetical protein